MSKPVIKTLDEYIEALVEITAKETGKPKEEIKINREAVKSYFDDGIPPYYCFREEWN
jgi:hypothetical protein